MGRGEEESGGAKGGGRASHIWDPKHVTRACDCVDDIEGGVVVVVDKGSGHAGPVRDGGEGDGGGERAIACVEEEEEGRARGGVVVGVEQDVEARAEVDVGSGQERPVGVGHGLPGGRVKGRDGETRVDKDGVLVKGANRKVVKPVPIDVRPDDGPRGVTRSAQLVGNGEELWGREPVL